MEENKQEILIEGMNQEINQGNLRVAHSKMGIASFVLALSAVVMVILGTVLAVIGYAPILENYQSMTPGDYENFQKELMANLNVFMIFGSLLFLASFFVALLGAVFGIVGIAQKQKKRLFGILGLAFSGAFILFIIAYMALSLMLVRG